MSYTTIDKVAGMFPSFSRPAAWSSSTWSVGATIKDPNGNIQKCTTGGSSGPTIPNPFATQPGATTLDGTTVIWTCQGPPTVQQKPADTLIQTLIDDVAAEIDSVLQRRFAQAILTAPGFTAFIAALPPDAVNILEKINRYGAAVDVAAVLASFGNKTAADQGKNYEERYDTILGELAATDDKGKSKQFGRYDLYFDKLSQTQTPRPAMLAVAGADTPIQATGQTDPAGGGSQMFSRDMKL